MTDCMHSAIAPNMNRCIKCGAWLGYGPENTRSASGGDSASLGVDSIDRCLEHPEALGYVDVAGFKRWVALNPGAVSQLIISLFNELPLDTIRPAVIARLTDAPAGNPEQLASLEQRARELLARELDAIRFPAMAAEIRDESGYNTCGAAMVRVVTAALANQQGVGGALPAPARTREVEKDAGPFYAACQRACAELPNGWEIRVCLEKDAGTVELCDPDGGSSYMDVDADDPLTAEVHAAIDAAMSTPPAGDVGRVG